MSFPCIYRWPEFGDQLADSSPLDLNRPLIILFDVRAWHPGREFALSMFNAEELERARRFHFEVDRNQFLAARGIVRSVLSRWAGTAPESIEFGVRQGEKPRVLNPECIGIDVSISHAAGRVACAFVHDRSVGVDIESVEDRRNVDMRELARSIFSSAEIDALERSPRQDYRRLSLRCWTRKEAVLKGAGVGLSVETTSFNVMCYADNHVVELSPVPFVARLWHCLSLSPEPELELAVAWTDH